jgi:hypothetical protein
MIAVWIVLGLVVWTAGSVAAGIVIGRMIGAGRRPSAEGALDEQERHRAEAA